MSCVQDQINLMEKLSQNLHADANFNYDKALYIFTFLKEYDTVKDYFEFYRGGAKFNEYSVFSSENFHLVEELRKIMKVQTGGGWLTFTLTLDSEGKANSKFTYP